MFGLPTHYLILGFVCVLGAASVSAYFKGRADANANCQTAALTETLATLRADLMAAKNAENRAKAEAENNARTAETNAAIIEEIRNAKDPACLLDAGDVERLRGIR